MQDSLFFLSQLLYAISISWQFGIVSNTCSKLLHIFCCNLVESCLFLTALIFIFDPLAVIDILSFTVSEPTTEICVVNVFACCALRD